MGYMPPQMMMPPLPPPGEGFDAAKGLTAEQSRQYMESMQQQYNDMMQMQSHMYMMMQGG